MKCLVVYSSKTGNTKMIAQSIINAMSDDTDLYAVEDAPDPENYDFIAVGAWVDKGMPDAKAQTYMLRIKNKKVGIFLTLGAYPDSEHANDSMRKACGLLEGNDIRCTFICQGKVDPKLIEMMQQMTKDNPDHPHAMNEERKARLAEAAKHPDQGDCWNAARIFKETVAILEDEIHA